MIFILGIITGLIMGVLVFLIVSYFRPVIERTIKQADSLAKRKGEILEPENDDVEEWLKNLPKGAG